jgi:3-methyladenine DNA glycosylase AlkD
MEGIAVDALIVAFQERLDEVATQNTKTWWESYLKKVIPFRGVGIPVIRELLKQWQARCSVVAFVSVKQRTAYYPLIAGSCATLIKRPERFAKTGVGWILREISKEDPGWVLSQINKSPSDFSRESLRNALKYFSPDISAQYLRNPVSRK